MTIPQKAADKLNLFFEKVTKYANDDYGYTIQNDSSRKKCIVRNALPYTKEDYLNKAWFGFVRPEESTGGPYCDYSLVFFPDIECKYCIISFGIGSEGLNNDRDVALLPSTRRLFNRIRLSNKDQFFYKTSFDDDNVTTPLLDFLNQNEKYQWLVKIVESYKTKLPACQIVELPENLDDLDDKNNETRISINAWLACYAKFRDWGSVAIKKKIDKAIELVENQKDKINQEDIWTILERDRYVVLQGAPGTGKTYTATNIASKYFGNNNVIFEQFHAETSYSDFVYGIRPRLEGDKNTNLEYVKIKGSLLRAIEKAKEVQSNTSEKEKRVLLIIDEINRANLSNVLGPVFYLFEKHSRSRGFKITIGDTSYDELPPNLYVIATMNTADRSLAVVDFALRRRFTWITLHPKSLDNDILNKEKLHFHIDDFKFFEDAFFKYASDDELNLQPGQSYFITAYRDNIKELDSLMIQRLKYELMPLIKEYINEGYIRASKDIFENYFYERTGTLLYE